MTNYQIKQEISDFIYELYLETVSLNIYNEKHSDAIDVYEYKKLINNIITDIRNHIDILYNMNEFIINLDEKAEDYYNIGSCNDTIDNKNEEYHIYLIYRWITHNLKIIINKK